MKRFCILCLSVLLASALCACGRVNTPENYAKAYCGAENVAFDLDGKIWFVSASIEGMTGSVEQYDTLTEFAPVPEPAPGTISSVGVTLTAQPKQGDETVHFCICNLGSVQVQIQISLQVKLNKNWYILPGETGSTSVTVGVSDSVFADLPICKNNPPIPGQYRLVASGIDVGVLDIVEFIIAS